MALLYGPGDWFGFGNRFDFGGGLDGESGLGRTGRGHDDRTSALCYGAREFGSAKTGSESGSASQGSAVTPTAAMAASVNPAMNRAMANLAALWDVVLRRHPRQNPD